MTPSPFPKHRTAADRALTPSGVDAALCRQLIALIEREPETVAEQVRAWLLEEHA